MYKPGARLKYTDRDNLETFYTFIGSGLCAGRDQPLHGTVLMIYQSEQTGEVFLREPENFTQKLELVCNHDTRLGNSKTGVISCADCNRRL